MAFSFNGFGGGSDYRPPSSITNNMGSWDAPLNYTSPFQSTDPNGTNYTTAANATRMNSMMGQQQPSMGLGSVSPGQPQPGGPQLFDAMTNIGQPQQPQFSAYSGGGRFFNGQQIGGGQQITRNGQTYLTPGAMGGGLSGLGQTGMQFSNGQMTYNGMPVGGGQGAMVNGQRIPTPGAGGMPQSGGQSGFTSQGGNRYYNGTQIGGVRNIGGQMVRTPGAMGGGYGAAAAHVGLGGLQRGNQGQLPYNNGFQFDPNSFGAAQLKAFQSIPTQPGQAGYNPLVADSMRTGLLTQNNALSPENYAANNGGAYSNAQFASAMNGQRQAQPYGRYQMPSGIHF